MFCTNCGTQLPNEASFCWKCGRPQSPGMKVEEEKWETCEIEFVNQSGFLDEIQYKTMGYFNAKAIGQRGIYSAGKTAKIKLERYNKQTDQALKALVAQLVQEGWEPVPASGEDWYTHIFRRRAN